MNRFVLLLIVALAIFASVEANGKGKGKGEGKGKGKGKGKDDEPSRYRATWTFIDEEIIPGFPMSFDTFEPFYALLSVQEIEDLRLGALNWLNYQYGIPIEGAFLDSSTNATIIPGIGLVMPTYVYFNYDYSHGSPPLPDNTQLLIPEFVFHFNPDQAGVFEYGGVYGQWQAARGRVARPRPDESISYGTYLLVDKDDPLTILRKTLMKSKFPNRGDPDDGFLTEEVYLEDAEYGDGIAQIRIKVMPTADFSAFFVQINSVWTFNPLVDPYTDLGY